MHSAEEYLPSSAVILIMHVLASYEEKYPKHYAFCSLLRTNHRYVMSFIIHGKKSLVLASKELYFWTRADNTNYQTIHNS